jgi:Transposase
MRTLIVGIDVSQAHNDVGALTETGEVVDRPRRFANDRFGFEEFTEWAADVLDAGAYDRLQIGSEATGVLADLHIRSETGAIASCSSQFACSVTFRHNLPP